MRVCAFCGEMYDGARASCPHCGADAELTFADDSYDPDLGFDAEELDYDGYLQREGLAPAPPRARLRRPGAFGTVLFIALAVGLALGLLWVLL